MVGFWGRFEGGNVCDIQGMLVFFFGGKGGKLAGSQWLHNVFNPVPRYLPVTSVHKFGLSLSPRAVQRISMGDPSHD